MMKRLAEQNPVAMRIRRLGDPRRLAVSLARRTEWTWVTGILVAVLLLTVAFAAPEDRVPVPAGKVRASAAAAVATPPAPRPAADPQPSRPQSLLEWLTSGGSEDVGAGAATASASAGPATVSADEWQDDGAADDAPLELFEREAAPRRSSPFSRRGVQAAKIETFATGATLGAQSGTEPVWHVAGAEQSPASTPSTAPAAEAWQPMPVYASPSYCPPCPRPIRGLHCNADDPCRDLKWKDAWLIPWEVFAHGDYIGPSRLPHVPEYRLRVDDQLEFVFRVTGRQSMGPYRINVGDKLQVESLTDETLQRTVIVQRDGSVTLSQVGQVPAAGRTIDELRQDLDDRYRNFIQNPAITVSPVEVNTTLEELRATVDSRFGSGGQSRTARVTPEGTVQLPAIGSVPAHGLTLAELGREIDLRYSAVVDGLEVTPILLERAPRYIFVLGEVQTPGRYTLEGPTTLMQAIAMAGGWNVGASTRHVIVFRRDQNWCLMAARVNLKKPLYGWDPCPDGEMWLQDSDIVLVPKSGILVADEIIELVFTRGLYGIVPFNTSVNFVKNLSTVAGPVVVPVP